MTPDPHTGWQTWALEGDQSWKDRDIEEKYNLKYSNNLRMWKRWSVYRDGEGRDVVGVGDLPIFQLSDLLY